MKTTHLFATILLIQSVSYSFAFTWNRQNVDQLFLNSDTIFDEVAEGLVPEEIPCLDQFKIFVNQLKARQIWAVSCKFLE